MAKNRNKKNNAPKTNSVAVATLTLATEKQRGHQSSGYNANSNTAPLPLPFPSHFPRPTEDFLREEDPYKESFQSALTTAYEGFVIDETVRNEATVQENLQGLLDRKVFRRDVTQPFGLGTKCAKTYVTRCLLGEPGTTYKYLGLRMFAHPWETSEINLLGMELTQRTQEHLKQLNTVRRKRGAPPTRGRAGFDICLINRMEATSDLKTEPSLGTSSMSVSWHADSSLEHYSSIAVYQTLIPTPIITHKPQKKDKPTKGNNKGKWSVALRVAHNSEGPQASRRGTDIDSSIVKETPPIAVTLPSGSAYYLLDDFNHHHQHTVLTDGDAASAGVRFSCTYRLLRDSHNVAHMISRCRTACSNFHKKGSKLWRSEQLLLTELESEWIRQFYIQGSLHHDLLWKSWGEPVQQLLRYWSQLESRTKQTIDLLRAAAEGRCGVGVLLQAGGSADQTPSKAERKARDRRKKALSTLEDLLERSHSEEKDALKSIYEPLAELIEQRAENQELWGKREKDHAFHDVGPEYRPMTVPVQFERPIDEKVSGEHGSSPMPETPAELQNIAISLRALGKAYQSGKQQDLPIAEKKEPEGSKTSESDHAKLLDWPGWNQHGVGLELQDPWAGAVVDGRKIIETRSYDLPPALIGKRIMIIQSPPGTVGVTAMGNLVDFSLSKATVIGWCTFASVNKYTTREAFEADESGHLVSSDSGYAWQDGKTKIIYGWVVGECGRLDSKSPDFHSAVRRMRSLFQLKVQAPSGGQGQRKEKKKVRADDNKPKKRRKRY